MNSKMFMLCAHAHLPLPHAAPKLWMSPYSTPIHSQTGQFVTLCRWRGMR